MSDSDGPPISERAELYSEDEKGNRIPQQAVDNPCAGCGLSIWACEKGVSPHRTDDDQRCCADCWHSPVMKARPSAGGAKPAGALTASELERAQEWSQRWLGLTRNQREAWRLRNDPRPSDCRTVTREHTIQPREVEQYERAGWEMVDMVEVTNKAGEKEPRWRVRKDVNQIMTYDEIGARLGVSGDEARRLEKAAAKKLPARRPR